MPLEKNEELKIEEEKESLRGESRNVMINENQYEKIMEQLELLKQQVIKKKITREIFIQTDEQLSE